MKKTSIYFIVPLAGLLLFGGFYWNFRAGYDAHQQEIAQKAKDRKQEKERIAAEQSEKAIAIAQATQKQRKKEREEREARDRKMRDDKENARLVAEKADSESQKLARQVDKVTGEVKTANEEIAKLEADDAAKVAELAFLKDYIKKAEDNRTGLAVALTKIQAADDALAKQAALAAAEAAKNH